LVIWFWARNYHGQAASKLVAPIALKVFKGGTKIIHYQLLPRLSVNLWNTRVMAYSIRLNYVIDVEKIGCG